MTSQRRCSGTSTTTGSVRGTSSSSIPRTHRTYTNTANPSAAPGVSPPQLIGRVQWELIEPLDDKSDYARFLAEKGEGVHHIAVAPTNFDQALADQANKGHEAVLSGTFSGIRVAYLPTEQDLGVIVEIFSRDPAPEQQPAAT